MDVSIATGFIIVSFLALTEAQSAVCNVPSEMWCDTPELQKLCGTQAVCAKYNDTVKGLKVNLTIVYTSLCPYCQNFTRQVLYPKVWKNLKDIVNIQMLPYGNAHQVQVRFGIAAIDKYSLGRRNKDGDFEFWLSDNCRSRKQGYIPCSIRYTSLNLRF